MTYTIRHAEETDLSRILEIYHKARLFMAQTGNPNQWGTDKPAREQLEADISQKRLHVITDEQGIHGVFYYYLGDDPTYHEIEDGAWRREDTYGTIHRIAGDGSGGILRQAVAFALTQCPYVRIDTHADNRVMQRAIAKAGFERCGIIYVEDGSPRIAYDLFRE